MTRVDGATRARVSIHLQMALGTGLDTNPYRLHPGLPDPGVGESAPWRDRRLEGHDADQSSRPCHHDKHLHRAGPLHAHHERSRNCEHPNRLGSHGCRRRRQPRDSIDVERAHVRTRALQALRIALGGGDRRRHRRRRARARLHRLGARSATRVRAPLAALPAPRDGRGRLPRQRYMGRNSPTGRSSATELPSALDAEIDEFYGRCGSSRTAGCAF